MNFFTAAGVLAHNTFSATHPNEAARWPVRMARSVNTGLSALGRRREFGRRSKREGNDAMVTVEQVREALTDVLDPELQIDIVNLGMVYDIAVEDKTVKVTMTLTSMGCPIFDGLKREIEERIQKLGDVDRVEVELTFDPPWSPDRMSEEARLAMKYLF